MSYNKPKETIEYVIRLQQKERQLFEDFTTAYSIRSVGQGVGSILNPISNFLGNAEVTILLLPILYALFYPHRDMEGHDPLLFHAITGGPTNFYQNFTLWYMAKRKQAIESETPEDRERWEAMEGLFIDQIPFFGTIARAFR